MIIDTHAHYEDDRYNEDRDALLSSMPRQGVGLIVDVGAGIRSTEGAVALSEAYDFVYASVGIHPEEIQQLTPGHMDWLEGLAAKEKVVAIGEIGLDYHYQEPDQVYPSIGAGGKGKAASDHSQPPGSPGYTGYHDGSLRLGAGRRDPLLFLWLGNGPAIFGKRLLSGDWGSCYL